MSPKSNIFTRDIECVMIEMVTQRPLLWDTTIEQYRRTDLKRMHWDEIAEALGPKNFTDISGLFISFSYFIIVFLNDNMNS